VCYRWMYPIERMLKKLKSMVGNKAKVEGCIVEGNKAKVVVVRGNEMVLVILGLLSSISTSISDLNCDLFKLLINSICGLNISSKQFAC
jgi:hypothetical protein